MKNNGPKNYVDKTRWKYFPFLEAEELVDVFADDVVKYGKPFTYRDGIDELDLAEAAIRHLVAILNGESFDLESGLSHWAHVSCNGLMGISQLIRKEMERK